MSQAAAALRAARHRERRRHARALLGAAAALVVTACVAMSVGAIDVSAGQMLSVLVGGDEQPARFVVMELRLPRIVLGTLTGIAFGVAGAVFQSVLRNPLASPDLIGVTWGASVAAVFALIVLRLDGVWVSLAAFAGGVVTVVLVWALAAGRPLSTESVVVIGIGVGFVANAALGILLTRSDVRDAQSAMVWLVGSVGSARWGEIAVTAACLAVLLPLVALLARDVAAMDLGDDLAAGLGVPTARRRAMAILVATALVGVATAVVGPMAAVAFVAGPIARRLVGAGAAAIAAAGAIGAVLINAADLIAGHAVPGVQVPAGVVTGALGAVYLVWLLVAPRRARAAA